MGSYILTMNCISGDDVQVAIHRREDVLRWLRKLDHEGSSWSVVCHDCDGDVVMETSDITADIEKEYQC